MKKGQLYKHFKGSTYKILEIARGTEDMLEYVVYEDTAKPLIWTRKKDDFESLVDKEKYPDATQEYRFELVGE